MQPQGRVPLARIVRPHADAAVGHAGLHDDRERFFQGIIGGAVVGAADRPVDGDAAGGVTLPVLGEGEDFSALHRRKAAAAGADEQHQRLLAFLQRDRVALAVGPRNAAGGVLRRRGVAAGQRRGQARDQQAAGAEDGAATARDVGNVTVHRSSPRRVSQSRMNPTLPR